jgi:sulfoxide reductase heme-binding subunit YedZ
VFAAWLKSHLLVIKRLVFALSAMPALYLGQGLALNNLGANPLETLMRVSGLSALVVLTLTLSITPLRRGLTLLSRIASLRHGKRTSDWNWLVRLRRMLGLWCFAYACLHATFFVEFDTGYEWAVIYNEFVEKPYLLAGFTAFGLLWPLAMTSPPFVIRRMGRHWATLHKATYAVAVLGLLHYWWLVKPGVWRPLPYTLILCGLLGYRYLMHLGFFEKWEGSDGRETAERQHSLFGARS